MANVPTHFSSPLLSNWQAAVAKTILATSVEQASPFRAAMETGRLDTSSPMLKAATAAAAKTQDPTLSLRSGAQKCAKFALDLALAKIRGDAAAIQQLSASLGQFGGCDPRWGECITEFVAHYATTTHGSV